MATSITDNVAGVHHWFLALLETYLDATQNYKIDEA